ncbi:myomegalin-like isoform X2 [Haliotis asinina]|uniref:myomegalin-like isoform X2 n=1 Tax=Haliotis asinina TaxID=109174 RepID=UPI0035326324
MDSIVGFDPTLPIDLDGSANRDLLPEITFGNHLEYQDGSIPMVTKQSNGRMSPIRARTMKEYDQQIAELKKENFSLKLRIYFLEERMQQKFGDGEDVFKTNIELKVQVESLKKELMDKQELLKKASTAMESLTSNHETELNQIRSQMQQEKNRESVPLLEELRETQQKMGMMEHELELQMEALNTAHATAHKHTQEIQKLQEIVDAKEKDIGELSGKLEAEVEQTRQLDTRLSEMGDERQDLQVRLDHLQKELDRRDRDMLDVVDDQQENLGKLQDRLDNLQSQLQDKDNTIGKLEDALRDKEEKNKDLENKLRPLEQDVSRLEENSLKRDKTIQGLVVALHDKNKESASLEEHLLKSEEDLEKLRAELHEARMARHQAEETFHTDMDGADAKIARLEQTLRENELQLENLMRALGKKDGELGNFKDLLSKAENALRQSEKSLETLQEQLQQERDQAQDRLDGQAQHYKRVLDDAQNEVKMKGDLLKVLEDRLKDKDKQLQEYVGLLSQDGQVGVGDLHKALAEKNQELRNLKQKLAGHDTELEDTKRQLKAAEDALQALDGETGDTDSYVRQLTGQLRTAQQELEAAVDGQARVMEDKRRAVKHLEALLADKDAALQDALEYNGGDGSRLRLLRDQLREKDKLLEELMAEKNRSVLEGERANRNLLHELKERQRGTDDMKLYQLLEEQLQEIRHLSDMLLKEKQIFITLNQEGRTATPSDVPQTDRSEAFLTELGAVQALRQQLQEGVERNNNLRVILEHQITGPAPAPGHSTTDNHYSSSATEEQHHINSVHRSPNWDDGGCSLKTRSQFVDAQTSPVRHGASPGESGYHDLTETHSSSFHGISTQDQAVSASPDIDHHEVQCSATGRDLLPEGQITVGSVITKCVGTSPWADHRSVQTSPHRPHSTQNRSTLTSPFTAYQSAQTSPLAHNRTLSPGTSLSGSENKRPAHRSLPSYNDVQTSPPIAKLNNSVSPVDILPTTKASSTDSESLSKMSSSMLRKLVQQLQEDLVAALKQNNDLQGQMFGECETREVPGRNEADPTVADFQQMQQQIDELRSSLDRRDKENDVLRSHLGLDHDTQIDSRDLPYLHDLQNEVHKLKAQLKEVVHANELLKKQINISSQSDDYPAGFNPSLIIDMARELEALKSELEKSRKIIAEQKRVTFDTNGVKSSRIPSWNDDASHSELGMIDGASNSSGMGSGISHSSNQSVKNYGRKGSQIPRLKNHQPVTSNITHEHHPVILQRQLQDAADHIKQLEKTLAATEETVRYQSQKVKYYRGLLKDAGIVPLQDSRSQSETCLTRLSGNKSWTGSVENLAARNTQDGLSPLRVLSLESVKEYGNTDNVYELKHQIKDMQEKLEKSLGLSHRYNSASGSSERLASPARRSLSPSLGKFRTQSTDNIAQVCQMSGSLEKLQRQVWSLESQLQESKKFNSDLQLRLKELQNTQPGDSLNSHPIRQPIFADRGTSPLSHKGNHPSSQGGSNIPALQIDSGDDYRHEIASLRKQLQDSQNVNTLLKDELEELSHFLSELMVHDQNGHNTDVGLADINSIRSKLNQSLDVLRTTTSDISVLEPQSVRGSVAGGVTTSMSDSFLHGKYQEALHSNQQLRHQLAQLQDMYQKNLHSKTAEVRQLQQISERFQQELEAAGKLRIGEADGSPLSQKRVSSVRKLGGSDTLDSSSPCDGLPQPSFLSLSRVPAGLCKSGSMESDDIADIHKQTDENYGRPLRDSAGDSCVEQLRQRTGNDNRQDTLGLELGDDQDLERMRHRTGSDNRRGTLGLELGVEKGDVLERMRHRTASGVTNDLSSVHSAGGDMSVFKSPKSISPEKLSFQRKVMERDSVDFPFYSNQSGLRFSDITLNPSLKNRQEDAQDFMDSSGTTSKKSTTLKMSDCDSDLVSSRERSQTPLNDVGQLQARLGAMEDLNKTLKDELSIYETLCKSFGIQNTPRKSQGEATSPVKTDIDSLSLREHLVEIRAMRQKLEEGLEHSDRMRDELLSRLEKAGGYLHHDCDLKVHELEQTIQQLQQKLATSHTNVTEKIYIIDEHEKVIQNTRVIMERQRREMDEKEKVIEKLRRSMEETQSVMGRHIKEIAEKDKLIESMRHNVEESQHMISKHKKELAEKEKTILEREKTISEWEQTISEREQTYQKLQQKKEKMEAMLKKASKEIKRLNLEVGDLRDREEEKAELNKTLRLELSVYEKLQGGEQENDEKSCIRELLTEIRRLRVQLERSIDANDTLRSKLEEILRQQLQQQQHQQQRNNSPTGSHTTDAPDGRPSPESTLRPERKSDSKTKDTYIRTHRSDKEYKYSVITREAGLHDDADHVYSDFTSTTASHHHTDKTGVSPCKDVHMSQSLPVPPAAMSHGTSLMSLPDDLTTVPERRHLASMENIKYWVDSQPGDVMKDFPVVRVDSDIRRLFAIGKLDDFEKLRKENGECVATLSSIQARVSDRLKTLKGLSTTESVEYSTLKELGMSAENLRICLEQEQRLVSAFWISQLPPINELGEFFDPKMASENEDLKRNLVHLRSKYDLLKHQVREADHRLQATNRQRENVEQVLYKQLSKTYKVLHKAGSNMEKSARESGFKIPTTKR